MCLKVFSFNLTSINNLKWVNDVILRKEKVSVRSRGPDWRRILEVFSKLLYESVYSVVHESKGLKKWSKERERGRKKKNKHLWQQMMSLAKEEQLTIMDTRAHTHINRGARCGIKQSCKNRASLHPVRPLPRVPWAWMVVSRFRSAWQQSLLICWWRASCRGGRRTHIGAQTSSHTFSHTHTHI